MRGTPECVPCLLRLALRAARQVTDDAAIHRAIQQEAAAAIRGMDPRLPPPVMAAPIYALICDRIGVPDPLRSMRRRDNELALSLLPKLRTRVQAAADPFGAAVRMSAAGNAIDFAACGEADEATLTQAIEQAMAAPIDEEIDRLRRDLRQVDELLFLADNAGEIVLDRLLIEQLPDKRVTLAVRGGPSLNDALLDDAETAGLTSLCEVIDNGSTIPGTLLSACSVSFVERFHDAPLIIAKGQGNYETLSDAPAKLVFILKVKCPVVAAKLARPLGTVALGWAPEEETA